MKSHITYIESKAGGLVGPARIGRVTFSKSGATLYYAAFEVETGEPNWISDPRRMAKTALYATNVAPEVDRDVRVEYWSRIRGLPVPTGSK